MNLNQITNLLVTITLVELMVAVGMSVRLSDLSEVARDWRLAARAVVGNYVIVPVATVVLLMLFRAPAMVAAGFLILAVCPGAPYGPPFTRLAKGNVVTAVGLMVLLAGSSAIVAPILLPVLLPRVSGEETLTVNASKIAGTLLLTQMVPLCVGIALRHRRPLLADRLQKPAELLSKILNLAVFVLILVAQHRSLTQFTPRALAGMLALLLASLIAGYALGTRDGCTRRAMTLTTSLRNVGVGLVIATGSFPGTPAVTAVVLYGLVEVAGSLLLAIWWGRRDSALDDGQDVRSDDALLVGGNNPR
jgi:bile acid:Na+ symporter, BASS family